MIEVEKRGRLTATEKQDLLSYLTRHAQLIADTNSTTIFIEFDSAFLGTIENTKASISIALNRNLISKELNCYLKAKSGKMEATARNESIIPFELKNINDILTFLNIFYIKTGCPRFYHRQDFTIDGLTITVKESGLAPDHFEIETMVESEDQITTGEAQIDTFVKNNGLTLLTKQEYKDMMLTVFHHNPPIPLSDIDLTGI